MALKLKYMPVDEIIVLPKDFPPNAAKEPPDNNEAYKRLKQSIMKDGLLLPVFINWRREIICGHYRYWAARDVGCHDVPYVFVKDLNGCLEWIEKSL